MPRRLYGISKLAAELITERYGDLFHLSTASVRPRRSSVRWIA